MASPEEQQELTEECKKAIKACLDSFDPTGTKTTSLLQKLIRQKRSRDEASSVPMPAGFTIFPNEEFTVIPSSRLAEWREALEEGEEGHEPSGPSGPDTGTSGKKRKHTSMAGEPVAAEGASAGSAKAGSTRASTKRSTKNVKSKGEGSTD